MTSFNELALAFRNIIDDLFNSNGFECRKLFYGDEIFYCGRDILKCLNYGDERRSVREILSKINENDKFTIKELQEKYLSLHLKGSDKNIECGINQELLNKLDKYEMKYIYVNKVALYELIGSSKKPEAKPFKDFIYRTLLPALDNKYKELLNQKNDKIDELNTKIDQLLSGVEVIKQNTEILKQDNIELKEDNEIINEELNNIKDEQEDLKYTIENKLIPNRNLPPSDDKLNHSFIIYKIDDYSCYCLRGQNNYIKRKLKDIDEDKIIIKAINYPNPIDFYQKFKEESKNRLEILKKKIIKTLKKRVEDFDPNSIKGKKLIDRNLNKLKDFTITSNTIYLNNSSIDDIMKFYNSLLEEKNEY